MDFGSGPPGEAPGAAPEGSSGTPSVTGWGEQAAALMALAEVDPTTLTARERGEAVRALVTVAGQVEAALHALADTFATRHDHERDGARSAAAWVTARTELSRSQANGLFHRAELLRRCPATLAAYRAGAIGTAKVRALLRAREGVEDRFAADEAFLIDTIAPFTVARAGILLARWHELARAEQPCSPDDGAPGDGDDSLHLTATFEGRRVLTATYRPVLGAELEGLIDGEIDRGFHDGTFHRDDGLDPSQRRATALLHLARRGSIASTERANLRPSVTVIIDLNTLLGLDASTTEALLTHRCELADGTQVTLAQVLELMADATLNTVLGHYGLNGTFHPVGEITTTRSATARQRRALNLRDHGCVFPGCDRPATWTDAHHVDGWEATHQTSVPRLVLLCSFHHHRIHDHGFTLTSDHAGHVTVTRPDRTPVPAGPPGHHPPPDPDPPPDSRSGPPGFAPLAAQPLTPTQRDRDHTLSAALHHHLDPLLADLTALVHHLEAAA